MKRRGGEAYTRPTSTYKKEKKKPDPQRPRGSERKRVLTCAPSRPGRVGLRGAGVRAQGWRVTAAGGPLRLLEWR